jgi:AraC-like DNA-binding protein
VRLLPTNLGVVTYPPGATFGPRRTADYELVWIIRGDVAYERDGVAYACPAESIALCIPGHTDFFRWDADQPTRHAYFHFDLASSDLKSLPSPAEWPVVRSCPDADVVRPMFRHLLSWRPRHRSGTWDLTDAETQLLDHVTRAVIWAYVLGHDTTTEVLERSPVPPAVERATALIRKRLDTDAREPIELRELAKAGGVTPEHLCRLFRKHTGHSPAETIRLARLDRAAALLSRSNYTVAEVADLCGFASPFHFSRAFKHAYHQSPSDLRTRIRQGETPPTPKLLKQ